VTDAPQHLRLIGYERLTPHGFALPLFGTAPGANLWFVAEQDFPGDKDSRIERFEPYVPSDASRLPTSQTEHSAEVGGPFLHVFLWHGEPHLGTARDIWKALAPARDALAKEAPLSLLALGEEAGEDPARLAHTAAEWWQAMFGDEKAEVWKLQTYLRGIALRGFRRRLRAEARRPKMRTALMAVTVEPTKDGVRVGVPSSLEAAIAQGSAEVRELAFEAAAKNLGYGAVEFVVIRGPSLGDPRDIADEFDEASAEAVPDERDEGLFSMAAVKRLILAGRPVPPDWIGQVKRLHLGNLKISKLAPLASLAKLQHLSFPDSPVNDLLPVAELANLLSLNLRGTQVTNLAPLAGLAKLQTLTLESTQVADLAPLAGLVNLHTLDFGGTRVADLAPLAGLANLHTLDFGGTRVADLAPIAGLANLHTLDLNATQVADLAPLARLANLHLLRLNGTQVSDLAPLAGLANLETLDLRGTWELSDLAPIAGLARLQSLLISSTRVADLAPIAGLANLQTLFLSSTQVSDLAPLAKLANLQTLWLDGTRVSDLAPLAGLAKLTVSILGREIRPFDLARQGRSLRVADILK